MRNRPRTIAAAILVAAALTLAGCTTPYAAAPVSPTSLTAAGVTSVAVTFDDTTSIPTTSQHYPYTYGADLHVALTFVSPAAAGRYTTQVSYFNANTKKFVTQTQSLQSPYCLRASQAGTDFSRIVQASPPQNWTVVIRFRTPGSAWGPWMRVGKPKVGPTVCLRAA